MKEEEMRGRKEEEEIKKMDRENRKRTHLIQLGRRQSAIGIDFAAQTFVSCSHPAHALSEAQ